MQDLDRINKKMAPFQNVTNNAIEAVVTAFYNQLGHRLMRQEPGLLTNVRSTMQLCGAYFRPANPEESIWASIRNRTYLVADQDKPRYWCTNE